MLPLELTARRDVGRAAAVVGQPADAAGVQQLAVVEHQPEVEEALVLGEERALVALKKVSSALKFTTSESLSTWPKSGLSVAVSWNCPFGFQNRSRAGVPKLLSRDTRSCTPTT